MLVPLKHESDDEDEEGQWTRHVQILRLRERGLLSVFQVGPGHVMRQPKPLVPKPHQKPSHGSLIPYVGAFSPFSHWPLMKGNGWSQLSLHCVQVRTKKQAWVLFHSEIKSLPVLHLVHYVGRARRYFAHNRVRLGRKYGAI